MSTGNILFKINKFLFLNNKDNFQQNSSQKKDLCNKASLLLLTFVFVHVEILGSILDAIKSFEVLLFTWMGGEANSSQLVRLEGQLITWTAWAVSHKVHERPQGNINWYNKQRENKFRKCTSIFSTTHE